jgi:hypothetical protein
MAWVRRRRLLLGLVAVGAGPWFSGTVQAADAAARLIDALTGARNFKVRAHAATLLARVKDRRTLPALMRAALEDPHPAVRATSVRLLARVARGDTAAAQQARPVIGRAMGDREAVVRRQATASLADLERSFPAAPPPRAVARGPRGPTVVAVGSIGDRTGRAPRAIRERMRALMLALLEREPRIQVAAMTAPQVTFLVDGTIARLQVGPSGGDLESVCAVELVVSRPPRGIITVASGEAIVQHRRAQIRPGVVERMEEEALENAVRSAHESLAQFLKAQ